MAHQHHHSAQRRHCMVVHNNYPLREPRVEREARALVKHGYEVDVLCLRAPGEPRFQLVDGVRVYRLPVKRRRGKGPAIQLWEYLAFFTLAFARLAAMHRRRHYAVVQVHNLPDFLVFAALIPKLSGAQVILDIHDVMPEFYASRFNRTLESWPVRVIRWQEYLACRFADRVITVTDLWKQSLAQRGLPTDKIAVVMNVADDTFFGRSDGAAQRPAQRPFHVFYHGTLTHRYGIDLALRAIDVVRRQIPDVRLTIHGAGEFRDELMRLAAQLDLGEHVQFSSHFVPTPELPSFIQQADVGLVPYRRDIFTDGILPTKLMEYVACGVPVIAARTPVIESYFDDTMVQYFEPGNAADLARAILELHADRHRLAQLPQQAAVFKERYNWPAVRAGYLALVDALQPA